MIAAFLLLLQAVSPPGVATQSAPAAPPAATSAASVPLPPQDWSRLPMLPIRRSATIQANTSMYVRGEVMAGRCAKAVRTAQGWTLTLDLAVLATPQGRLRRVTPRAIDCPTVEQYAAGVVVGAARDSIDLGDTQVDTWYRTTMTFSWAAS